MAATRLIRLHVNKGRTLAACLRDRIDYAENPDKTEDGTYLSSYHCDPKTAADEFLLSKRMYEQYTGRKNGDIIAYQIRQSFRPGEVTAEEANRIGYDLAMSFTKGRHAFIVATHTDRAHIHNHIIYDATTLDYRRKFKNYFLSSFAIQRISDLLCLEHGLSVIRPTLYSERTKYIDKRRTPSIRDSIRTDIDGILVERIPATVDDLIYALEKKGYECKQGKNIAIRKEGQKRFIRFSSLGPGYQLQDLIGCERKSDHKVQKKQQFSILVDIQKKLSEGKGKGYEQWARNYNVKQMAEVLLYLQENKIDSYEDLVRLSEDASERFHTITDTIKRCETRMQEISDLKRHIINYLRTKDVYAEYRKHGYSKKYFEQHREELTIHKAAKQAFDAAGFTRLPKLKDLSTEFDRLKEEKKKAYSEYHKAKNSMKELNIARRNVETFLEISHDDVHEKERNRQATH